MNPINPNNQLEYVRPTIKAWSYVPPPIERKIKFFDEITNYITKIEQEKIKPKKMRRQETTVVTIKDISNGEL
jgi:S-adenosylmethionine hydrolase